MDTLEKELLLRDLDSLGYRLVQPHSADPSSTLKRVLGSREGRLLEGVPVVLSYVLTHDPAFNFESFEQDLPSNLQRRFRTLAAITYYFLLWVPDSEAGRKTLHKYLTRREPALMETVQSKLSKRATFNVGDGVSLDTERLENTFKNYVASKFYETQAGLSRKLDDQRQSAFMRSLAELFTAKQQEVLFKLLNKEPLTKTEREYYSRAIKPRLKALSNPDVQALSGSLLSL